MVAVERSRRVHRKDRARAARRVAGVSEDLPSKNDPREVEKQPEVRLELTRAGVEQVLSLYAQERGSRRADEGFSIGLEDLQQAFRERRRMIVVGLAAGVAFGLLVLIASAKLYSVAAQVVIERHDATRTGTGETAATGGAGFVATQAEIMASRSVVDAAVASLPRPGHLDPEDDAGADALESVVATPVTGTQVVSLGYLGPDAEYGVRLLEAIVVAYRQVASQLEQDSQQQKLDAKQVEVGLLEDEADAIERRIEALRGEHVVAGSGDDAAQAQSETLRDLTRQIAEVRNERIALQSRLATGSRQLAILDPATKALQDRLWEAEAELARVKLTLMPKHPAVEAAEQNVDVLRQQLRASASATPAALRRDIDALTRLEAQLERAHAHERERLVGLESYRREEGALAAELAQVRERTDSARSELVDQRLLTRLADAGEIGIAARIIEAPTPPDGPTWPRPGLILPAGAAAGLFGGFVAALISLRRSRQVEWAPATPPRTAEVQIR